MRTDNEDLLEYYRRELIYLRRMGAEFARQYPKVAGRLELGIDQSSDPHVERLIESFALLTARLQYALEGEFPRFSSALLGVLYPHFMQPTPSMTIARFHVDPEIGKLTSGHEIPRHTGLFAPTQQGQNCRFRTCYPVTLWPLQVSHARFESTAKFHFLDNHPNVALVLRLRLETMAGPISELGCRRLRFYLNGDRMLVNSLYELLFANTWRAALLPQDEKRPVWLPEDAILPVGFEPDQDVLPYPPNSHFAYRLLHEYFTFDEKFLFFDFKYLDRQSSENRFDILIMLDKMPEGRLVIDEKTFCLGCTPIINLFEKTSDPIRLDERHNRYFLHGDKRRERYTEIHSIRSVSYAADPQNRERRIAPYFSYNHHMARVNQKAHWFATIRPTNRADLPGTEMMLNFVDLDFNPFRLPQQTVYAHTLCTNRRLAEQVPAGALLQIERQAPIGQTTVLFKPTLQIDPPMKGATLWRLISHLSLNYLSLGDSAESLEALREILTLYSFSDTRHTLQQISGIREMECRNVTRWVRSSAWRGVCRGTEISLTLDKRLYVGNSAFLLAAVLNRFFPCYAAVNSFTQLIIKNTQRKGIWKQWPPMVGEQTVL